jgi:hypothetical protein
MRNSHSVAYFGLLSLTLGLASAGRAETTQCTPITVLPATIAQSGIYCLTSDLAYQPADGNAISINANDVVLDLNGHRLDNLKAGAGTVAAGIFASQRRNVVVKNGTIRGFSRAVFINDNSPYMKSQGWVIEDIRADRSTYAGMVIWGRDCLLRRNVVVATGGSTAYGPSADAVGIVLVGASHRVIDNDVIAVTKQGTGSATAIAFGIQTDGSIAVANRVTDAEYGVISLVTSVKFRDNLTTGVATPFDGGTDAGNND